jgi:hypothetical protein
MKYLVIYWIKLIIPFQLQLKILTCVISQKMDLDKFFIQMNVSVEKKHFVEKLFSFERWKKCWMSLYQNVRWNQIKTTPKIYPPKNTFLALSSPP